MKASRIQERKNALCSELATLEVLQHNKLRSHNECLKDDELASADVLREQLLTAVRSRNGLELECLQVEDDSRKVEQATSELKADAEGIRSCTEEDTYCLGTWT